MNREEAERLVCTLGQRVYRFAYARLGNRADAEDVTQETFLRLVRAEMEFPDDARALAWLFRVAANCANDLHRSPWRRRVVPIEEGAQLPAPVETSEPGGILEAVAALPEKYRTVIHLYYYEDLSAAEIAQALGVRAETVNTRLSRARTMLRERCKEVDGYVE